MKIVVDEDLPRALTKLLHNKHHEVFDVRDHGFRGASDEEVFNFAQQNRAVLFSGDLGFANITRFPLGGHYGICVLRFPNDVTVKSQLMMFEPLFAEIESQNLHGVLVILSPHRIRVRRKK